MTGVRILGADLEADAAHAGIHNEMEWRNHIGFTGGPGQCQSILIAENSGTDTQTYGFVEGAGGCVSQNENGLGYAAISQFQSLRHGADTKKGSILQRMGHSQSTVTVGIGLHHCQHRNLRCLANQPVVIPDNVQINRYIIVVMFHQISLRNLHQYIKDTTNKPNLQYHCRFWENLNEEQGKMLYLQDLVQ